MGYSTPKKQLDLKEFLSQPAKKSNNRGKYSKRPADAGKGSVPSAPEPSEAAPGEPEVAEPAVAKTDESAT